MQTLSSLALSNTPFFFLTDFLGENIEVYPFSELEEANIKFDFSNKTSTSTKTRLRYIMPDYSTYKKGFDKIIAAIKKGETYVLNYTQKTKLDCTQSLDEIYESASAKFKLKYKEQFVCFSPEPFIEISHNTITTYPMKGTIDATINDAKEILLKDTKELAEHTMIVDLLRNDLAQIASSVKVEKFRYLETIHAGDKKLIQSSSEISATLKPDYLHKLDWIFAQLLPAGSISGAPKRSTLKHILKEENYERGFYTGIMGYYNNGVLKSSVMIRFIENIDGTLYYKSGGGITLNSDPKKEFQEMLDKIYIP